MVEDFQSLGQRPVLARAKLAARDLFEQRGIFEWRAALGLAEKEVWESIPSLFAVVLHHS